MAEKKRTGSISSKLFLLIIVSVLPCLVILLFSGIEQRNHLIDMSKSDVSLLTHSMAEAQKSITNSTKELLSTLSHLPSIKEMNVPETTAILKSILEHNQTYNNFALVDPGGEVIASGKKFSRVNLADRKHFRDAIQTRRFSPGEYIVTRVGDTNPAFPFAFPVLDQEGRPRAVLTAVIKLDVFFNFYKVSTLPDKSFVSMTDEKGIRLFYYPRQNKTNPVGSPIRSASWERARHGGDEGLFFSKGSDDLRRLFAYKKVRMGQDDPYLVVWAGIPESFILQSANAHLIRNLVLMVLATAISLIAAWKVAQRAFVGPIKGLVTLTHQFASGKLVPEMEVPSTTREIGQLTTAFHDMADTLNENLTALQENETRIRLLMDSLEAVVYVSDITTHEILFINQYGTEIFGDVAGTICWQSLQRGMTGTCPFCQKKDLLDEAGRPGKARTSEFLNTRTKRWFHTSDQAIEWIDGHLVHLQVATDITERKMIENEREELIAQLKAALSEVKVLSGFLPICSHCKKIRDDQGYWNQIEAYISERSEAEFSHGICQECARKYYPDIDLSGGG